MQQRPSRRHHYISQFYLRGFTLDPRKPSLFAVELTERKDFWTKITRIALETDFHTVETNGELPDVVEEALSKFEGNVAPALTRTIENASFVSDNDKSLLLSYVALLL